jgi:hypothetical protein
VPAKAAAHYAALPRHKLCRFLPTIHPKSWSAFLNSVTRENASGSSEANGSRTPMRRIRSGCCARAANGHAAAPLGERDISSQPSSHVNAAAHCAAMRDVGSGVKFGRHGGPSKASPGRRLTPQQRTRSRQQLARWLSATSCRASDRLEMSPFTGSGRMTLRSPHHPRTLLVIVLR